MFMYNEQGLRAVVDCARIAGWVGDDRNARHTRRTNDDDDNEDEDDNRPSERMVMAVELLAHL